MSAVVNPPSSGIQGDFLDLGLSYGGQLAGVGRHHFPGKPSRMGVSQAAYAKTEAAAQPRRTTVTRVARALGLTVEHLDF